MKKMPFFPFWTIAFALTLCSFANGFATIREVEDLSFLEREIPFLDNNSLVIFDVDETLILPKDAVLGPQGKELLNSFIKRFLHLSGPSSEEKSRKERLNELTKVVMLNMESRLVDEKVPVLLDDLKARGVPVMALTAADPEKLLPFEILANWRSQSLAQVGIDFCSSSFFWNTNTHADFRHGILYSFSRPKGEVLAEFLESLSWIPSKVIFLDDRLIAVESVDKFLRDKGIECLALHYRAAEKIAPELDLNLAIFQLGYLVKYGVWLNDEKANSKMNGTRRN